MIIFILFMLICFMIGFAKADVPEKELYSPTPHCAVIRNVSDRLMNVTIRTQYYTRPNGTKDRYETNLRLEKGDFQEVCVKGPFYPDYKVALTITAMLPLFECKTKLQDEISLHAVAVDATSSDVYADCIE